MQSLTEQEIDAVTGGGIFEAIGRVIDSWMDNPFTEAGKTLDAASEKQSETMVPAWLEGNAMAGSIPGP
ncbi:hypothetical protein ACWCOP_09740 [Maricaulaceae bacterium MS644]